MAGFLSPATREQIRAASDIVDVIGSYVPLKKNGANFTALCPFHKEKSPSFNVNPHKQIFHCFGCHKGGDVFTFVKDYENIGFMDAVRRLAERAKIPLEFENTPGAQESRHLKDQLLDIHEQLTQHWQNCLANEAAGQRARDYLASRGVSPAAIKLFRIGAAPELWDDTVNWAHSRKFELEIVEKAGLIIPKSEAGSQKPEGGNQSSDRRPPTAGPRRYYDRFRGRLMFPICDEQGRVVAFSGRVLPGDESPAKYVNSPETPIFTKSKIFFGLDKSKRAILDAGYAIICEGQLDLIACFMGGVQNIVAPQGTAFTDQHARIIKRYANEVVLCFDSDNAGQNAIVRSLDHLLAAQLAVRVAVVPAPHDPDSFIKNFGGEAYRKLVESAEGFFDYLLKRLCATNDAATDKGRLIILRSMAEALHKTGNSVLIDTHAQKTALRLGVAVDAVRNEFSKVKAPTTFTREDDGPDDSILAGEAEDETPEPTRDEFKLLQLLLKTDEFIVWMSDCFDLNWIENKAVKKIISERIRQHRDNSWHGLPTLFEAIPEKNLQAMVTRAVSSGYVTDVKDFSQNRSLLRPFDDLHGFAMRMRAASMENELRRLEGLRSTLEPGSQEQIQTFYQLQDLKKLLKQPLPPLEK